MAKIYVTLVVEAKDKLEGCAKVKSIIKDRYDIDIESVSGTNPNKEIQNY